MCHNEKVIAINLGWQSKNRIIHRQKIFCNVKNIYACGSDITNDTSSQSHIQIDHDGKHSGFEDLIFLLLIFFIMKAPSIQKIDCKSFADLKVGAKIRKKKKEFIIQMKNYLTFLKEGEQTI